MLSPYNKQQVERYANVVFVNLAGIISTFQTKYRLFVSRISANHFGNGRKIIDNVISDYATCNLLLILWLHDNQTIKMCNICYIKHNLRCYRTMIIFFKKHCIFWKRLFRFICNANNENCRENK